MSKIYLVELVGESFVNKKPYLIGFENFFEKVLDPEVIYFTYKKGDIRNWNEEKIYDKLNSVSFNLKLNQIDSRWIYSVTPYGKANLMVEAFFKGKTFIEEYFERVKILREINSKMDTFFDNLTNPRMKISGYHVSHLQKRYDFFKQKYLEGFRPDIWEINKEFLSYYESSI